VLLPLAGGAGGAAAVEKHIAESMGSLYAPFMLGSLKITAWIRGKLLGQEPVKMAGSTLKDIAKVGVFWLSILACLLWISPPTVPFLDGQLVDPAAEVAWKGRGQEWPQG
jgi:hypothetical protein